MEKHHQIVSPNNLHALIESQNFKNSLRVWIELYFNFEVTTSKNSQKEQRRDLSLFLDHMLEQVGGDDLKAWSPRMSASFLEYLKNCLDKKGERRWNDRTVNRILAHLKTLAKWIHKHKPFPLGCPTDKLKSLPSASLLNIDRAFSPQERMWLLDAADLLIEEGGRSKDRKRYKNHSQRPRRKSYRPCRNRAIIYCLVETGMRRAAVTKINFEKVDFEKRTILTEEKGGVQHSYNISREGIEVIQKYIHSEERGLDFKHWQSPALFLASSSVARGDGRLSARTINNVWNEVSKKASLAGKTPHSARHAMGKRILKNTNGNIAAVQRQLGHKNVAYSIQYTRISEEELKKALDED